jgi:hypothetical protein
MRRAVAGEQEREQQQQQQASAERRVRRAAARERCRAAVACNVCKGRARLEIGMRAGLSHHLQLSHAVEPRVGQSAIVEHKGAGAGWGPLDTSSRGTVTGGAGAHAG